MATATMHFLDAAVEKLREWCSELMEELHWTDDHRAFQAYRAVLQSLRDRLPADEASHLGAQLPLILRGAYFEGWRPSHGPLKISRQGEFLDLVAERFVDPNVDLLRVVRAVLTVMSNHVAAGEMDDVRQNMPEQIRQLWP